MNSVPVGDLIVLIEQLRAPPPGPHPVSPELHRYMAAVAQGRKQAAQRIEELLTEYGVTLEEKSQ